MKSARRTPSRSPPLADPTGRYRLATGSVEVVEYRPGEAPAAPTRPAATRRPAGDLQVLSSQAGRALVQAGVPFQAATDLAHAWEHLRAADLGRTIGGRLGGGQIDPQLEAVFGQPWNVLEVAGAALSSGQVMSAIDLCAVAALLACGEPLQGSGRFYDLGELRRRRQRRQLAATPALRAWIDQLLAHPALASSRTPVTT